LFEEGGGWEYEIENKMKNLFQQYRDGWVRIDLFNDRFL
jgi:hypothetical protein